MLTSMHGRDTKNAKYSPKKGWGGPSFPCSCSHCSLGTVSLGLGPAKEVGGGCRRAVFLACLSLHICPARDFWTSSS